VLSLLPPFAWLAGRCLPDGSYLRVSVNSSPLYPLADNRAGGLPKAASSSARVSIVD
jgi:hypothetical protein